MLMNLLNLSSRKIDKIFYFKRIYFKMFVKIESKKNVNKTIKLKQVLDLLLQNIIGICLLQKYPPLFIEKIM